MKQPEHGDAGALTSEPAATDYGRLSSEREVLRALWGARKELVRSEIRRKMPYAHRPTLGRVGQILAALYHDGLLERVTRKAQGSRKAGFYSLSATGQALCRRLGFMRDEQLLFDAPAEMLRANLTRKRFSDLQATPGRIITAYSYRGGLGQTTMVAHVTRGLAKQLSDGQSLLAIDLDLEAPGLDALAIKGSSERCRGLGGLIVDFERIPDHKRSLWLRGALKDPIYVLKASEDLSNLFYLPNGLGSNQAGLSSSERAEAMTLLRAEAGTARRSDRDAFEERSMNFFAALREAILENFATTVIDSQTKNSVAAWIATQCLADELALCVDYKDTSKATIAGLRSVLANFLVKDRPRESAGGVLFLFRLAGPKTRQNLGQWIEEYLLEVETDTQGTAAYAAEELPYNVRLKGEYDKQNTPLYKHIVASLSRGAVDPGSRHPPEIRALLTLLDPGASDNKRSIAAGLLEGASLKECARLIEWYGADKALPIQTDDKGEKLLRGVIETLLISKIIQTPSQRNEVGKGKDEDFA